MHIEMVKNYGGLVLERILVRAGAATGVRYVPGTQWALSQCSSVSFVCLLFVQGAGASLSVASKAELCGGLRLCREGVWGLGDIVGA